MIMVAICTYISDFNVAPTVSFEQQTYSVNESNGPVQVVLNLSNPSSTDITVNVSSTDVSTTGEYCIDQWCIVYF